MIALEYLKSLPRMWLPMVSERGIHHPSNSDLWRLLSRGSVIINGKKPSPNEKIKFPITELVFYPKGKRVTIIKE